MTSTGETLGTVAGTETEPWSVDPTLNFNRIHIIESLPEQGRSCRTGQRLFEELEPLCATTPAKVEYHPVETKAEFCGLMLSLVSEAERGGFPFLHLEAHGASRAPGKSSTSRGMVLASGELVLWSELAPYLVAINEATRLRFWCSSRPVSVRTSRHLCGRLIAHLPGY